jgi:hypothetical protein
MAFAQEPAPKFLLSDIEQSKLETLQARYQAIQSQYELLMLRLRIDASAYANKTLADHNHPPGVSFDANAFQWKTEGDKK